MNGDKKPWASFTMWMGCVALAALILNSATGVEVSQDDQTTVANLIVQAIEGGAIILAMVGRYRATRQLVVTNKRRL